MTLLRKSWPLIAAGVGFAIFKEIRTRQHMLDLQDKVVLITGGSRGLGLAIAYEFASAGAKLALCARDEDELKRARLQLTEMNADVMTLTCDVADEKSVQETVKHVLTHYGRIDVLVNNAGIITAGPWQTLTRSDFTTSMDVIFWGTYNMTMAVLPHMRERRQGNIVNITSIGGKVSVPHLLAYSSAKFAAVGFSNGLHAELAQDNIIVTTVAPGLMRTGSQINAIIKGSQHKTEYTLFTLLDTLPVSSIDVQRAAKQIVQATRRGKAELIITLPAQLAARVYGAFPGLVTSTLSLVNRVLPSSEHQGNAAHTGAESETALTRSPLTSLGQKATRQYNERSEDQNA